MVMVGWTLTMTCAFFYPPVHRQHRQSYTQRYGGDMNLMENSDSKASSLSSTDGSLSPFETIVHFPHAVKQWKIHPGSWYSYRLMNNSVGYMWFDEETKLFHPTMCQYVSGLGSTLDILDWDICVTSSGDAIFVFGMYDTNRHIFRVVQMNRTSGTQYEIGTFPNQVHHVKIHVQAEQCIIVLVTGDILFCALESQKPCTWTPRRLSSMVQHVILSSSHVVMHPRLYFFTVNHQCVCFDTETQQWLPTLGFLHDTHSTISFSLLAMGFLPFYDAHFRDRILCLYTNFTLVEWDMTMSNDRHALSCVYRRHIHLSIPFMTPQFSSIESCHISSNYWIVITRLNERTSLRDSSCALYAGKIEQTPMQIKSWKRQVPDTTYWGATHILLPLDSKHRVAQTWKVMTYRQFLSTVT